MSQLDDAIEAVYLSVKDTLDVTLEGCKAALSHWDVVPLTESGEVVGAIVKKGNEIHVGYKRCPGASLRSHIRKVFNEELRAHGALVTSVRESNDRGLRFCRRMGFAEVERKGGYVFMRCERSNYE